MFIKTLCFVFSRQGLSVYPWLFWNSLYSPGWPWTQSSTYLYLPSAWLIKMILMNNNDKRKLISLVGQLFNYYHKLRLYWLYKNIWIWGFFFFFFDRCLIRILGSQYHIRAVGHDLFATVIRLIRTLIWQFCAFYHMYPFWEKKFLFSFKIVFS